MEIRNMEPNEIEAVRNLRINSYKEYEQCIPAAHWEVLKGTLFSDNDVKNNSKIYVATIDNKIVGSVVLFPPSVQAYEWIDEIQNYPEIRMLSVDPNIQGKGVGKALVNHCLIIAKDEGYEQIGLHTGSFMERAVSLYEYIGFKHYPNRDFVPMDDGIVVKAFMMKI